MEKSECCVVRWSSRNKGFKDKTRGESPKVRNKTTLSPESRPRGSQKGQTKITFEACARNIKRFQIIVMGHRDSLS